MAKRAKAAKTLRKGPTPGRKPVFRGDRALALRLERKWSQAEFAHKCGIAVRQISQAELGHADPNLRNFNTIVDTLGTTADYLLGRDGH